MRRVALALAALLGVAASDVPPPVYVMRHLDTPAGERDPELTAGGARRAQALVAWFEGKPLTTIYVSDYKRTRATAAPLARVRRLVPVVYDPADTPALVARVRGGTGAVLVIGHSNTVPGVVEALGGERPGALVHEDFGDVWTVSGGRTVRGRME